LPLIQMPSCPQLWMGVLSTHRSPNKFFLTYAQRPIIRKKAEFVPTLPPDRRYLSWIAAHRPVPGRSQRMAPYCLHPSEKSGLLARVRAHLGPLRLVAYHASPASAPPSRRFAFR
jgi:hypothetical protein